MKPLETQQSKGPDPANTKNFNLKEIVNEMTRQSLGHTWPWPKLSVDWRRFPEHPFANLKWAFTKPFAYSIVGGKDEGKSALNENIANRYANVVDVFGASDDEGLAWLRTPRGTNALLLRGQSVELQNCGWPTKTVKELEIADVDRYDVIISPSSFYSDITEEWATIARLMDKLKKRKHYHSLACMTVREAASLIYSRIAIGDAQGDAKAKMIYMLREMRHSGFALALDTLRSFAIDIDIRTLSDFRFIKAVGVEGLSDDLQFLYSMYEPQSLMLMEKKDFIVVCRKGPIGDGTFDCPGWHKVEGEDLLNLFDIKPKYSDMRDIGQAGARVSAYAHANIVKARFNGVPDPDDTNPDLSKRKLVKGMDKIGKAIGHSSRTIMNHINEHNDMIRRQGLCMHCTDAGCTLNKQLLE